VCLSVVNDVLFLHPVRTKYGRETKNQRFTVKVRDMSSYICRDYGVTQIYGEENEVVADLLAKNVTETTFVLL
jgi:hypothetical protein